MRRFMLAIGLIAFAVAACLLANIIPASGVFAGLKPKLIDQCRRIDVFPGTEDVTIDSELNVAFISADDRRATAAGRPVQGGVYVLKLDGTDRVLKASPDSFGEFHPHGLSLWRGEDGRKRLFVINHTLRDGDKVEIFDVGLGGALMHVSSISFPEMTSPNDIVGVGPRAFYVTNDRGFREGPLATLEAYFALPFSTLAYFDGQSGRIAARGLVFANGVNVSGDGRTLYVSEFLRRRLSVYARDPETGEIEKRHSIPVNTGPDNIELGDDGSLWVAGHTRVFDFLNHAENPAAVAPSHVIRINPDSGEKDDVLIDLNGTINASSAAAASGRTLVVGAVFDGHVMTCPVK